MYELEEISREGNTITARMIPMKEIEKDMEENEKIIIPWEHLWDAPDYTFKGRCKKCGFTHYFIQGHDAQYRFCPQCGEQKVI